MKYYLNYQGQFETLMVTLDTKLVTKTEKKADLVLLFHEKELVGVNILNVKEPDFPYGFVTYNKKAISLAKTALNNVIELKNEPQFVVAMIEQCEDIPNTHLRNCLVDIGTKKLQIVCGAPNAKVGLKTVCAVEGAFMPNGQQIVAGKLKGFDSFGMLCSAKELVISGFNDKGILELDKNYQVGKDFFEVK